MSIETNRPVVLLVEDEPDILHTTSLLLRHSGYGVMTASDPISALEMIDGRAPSIIVTDYMMPWMNGRDFVERLKGREKTRTIPVILATAIDTPSGPWDVVLRKPIDFAELLASIDRLLRNNE